MNYGYVYANSVAIDYVDADDVLDYVNYETDYDKEITDETLKDIVKLAADKYQRYVDSNGLCAEFVSQAVHEVLGI